MRKTIATLVITLSAICAVGAAQAEAPKHDSFDLDGYTYIYTVYTGAKGQTIAGIRYPDATPFVLNVKGSRVEGVSDGQAVSFTVTDAAGAAKDSEIYVVAKPKKAN